MATAGEIAEKILECGPLAVRAIKEAALRGLDMSLEEGLALETELASQVFRSEDAREGPMAFIQKRKPEYKGR
jgi:enoyl-CoA hydratase/carnithine racemase